MRFAPVLALLLAVPSPCLAQEVSFLLEQVYASSPVPVETQDPAGLTGRAARRYREQLQQQYDAEASTSSSESLLEEDVASSPVDVMKESVHTEQETESLEQETSSSEASSAAAEVESSSVAPVYVPRSSSSSSQDIEEQDKLTLEQLEEYRDEAYENIEEQMELLEEGFTITGTSVLGSPLTTAQRGAILRRNVRTVPQLKLFTRALAESDANIRQIEIKENTITFSYRQRAKLFGFIPLTYLLNTDIENGTATVHQPWWHIIAADNVDTFKQELSEKLAEQQVEDTEDIDISELLTAQQKLLEIMSSASASLFGRMTGGA